MSRLSKMASLAFLVLATGTVAFAQFSTEVGPDFLKNARPLHAPSRLQKDSNFNFSLENGSGIPGVDSLANFTGQFDANGIGVSGSPQDVWLYSMVGNRPERGGITFIQAPIIPVSLNLLAADGSVALHYDVTPFVLPTLLSPVFSPAQFSTSPFPTQWADADMRATFFHSMREDWHTLLFPELERQVTMSAPSGAYQAVANTDGSCCLFVLVDYNTFSNLLFPPTYPVDNTTLIGAAELSGVMTTKKISTFLFPNTYLYEGDVNNCCVLGFHGPDMEPGIPANGNLERFYMAIYASWISPGLFGSGFQDVAALSHEMAETFNDPFVGFDNVHNITPWWLSGNQCQDLLEVGDVVESLPANVTIPVKNIFGQTYSLQNVALLQWFEFQSPSTALGGAYSYPNPASLPALSPFENPGCLAP
jgi:hypothetical protein